jgi:hypothetical protein
VLSFSVGLLSDRMGLRGVGALIGVAIAFALVGTGEIIVERGFCCNGAVLTLAMVGGVVIAGETEAVAAGVCEISDGGKGNANTGSGSSPFVTILLMSNSCMILSGV